MARSRERRSRGRRSRRTDHPSRTGGENRSARTSEQEGHRMSRRDGTHGNVIGGRTHSDSGRNGKPETLSAADLMALDPLLATPIVQGILYVGVTLFAGKPKIGKSWMMLALALAVTTGSTIFGNTTVQQGEVLYLALEDNRRRLQRRIKKLLSDREPPAGLHFAFDGPRIDEGGLEALDKLLEEQPGINLVIVDTLARLKPVGSKKRTQYEEDRDSVDSLVTLADKHSVAIVLVHHLREMESDDPLDMIHGSAGLTGGVDSALVLKRRRGEADANLLGDGRDFENPVELALKWNASAATWTILGDAEVYAMSEQRRAISAVLDASDEPLGPKVIHERLNKRGIEMSYNAVREMLSKMAEVGQVKNLGRGKYVHPAKAN